MTEMDGRSFSTQKEVISALLEFPVGAKVVDTHPDGFTGEGIIVAHRPYVWGEDQDKLGILFDIHREDRHPAFPTCRVSAQRLRLVD